jgi:hypothetical protein
MGSVFVGMWLVVCWQQDAVALIFIRKCATGFYNAFRACRKEAMNSERNKKLLFYQPLE